MNKTIRKSQKGEPVTVWFEFEKGSDHTKMNWLEDDEIKTQPFETRSACRSFIDEMIEKFAGKKKMFEEAKEKLDKRIGEDEELKKLGRPSN
jgi:hypothetical protein